MKRIFLLAIPAFLMFIGCTKNDPITFDGTQVEFDAATWNANAAGLTYPIMTRVPTMGAATNTSQPLITRTSGTIQIRINLVGAHRSSDAQFKYQVVALESTAVEGTHYTALPGTGTIPANSSFGMISIPILNPGATSGSRVLVLQLVDNSDLKANFNYSKVGLSIAQN
ncbi:MAG: DUF4843 domain-containing protein [Bacteroidota bacterium]